MANFILTAKPFPRNDISELAQLFECSFDTYLESSEFFYKKYLGSLRTLIGLGFTAALADRDLFSIYHRYLQQFLNNQEGNFRKQIGAKTAIAQSTANMVQLATDCFYYLEYPPYYKSFLTALRYALQGLTLPDNKRVEEILLKLS